MLSPENSAGTPRGFPGDRNWDGPFQMPSDESHLSEVVVEQSLALHTNSTEQCRKKSLNVRQG